MFKFENKVWERGELAIGMDEVGRGAFAGPLGVGGVVYSSDIENIFKSSNIIIRDSKKMTELQRNRAYDWIVKHALHWHVELVPVEYINKFNISEATQEGFKKVVNKIHRSRIGVRDDIARLLIDAFPMKNHPVFTLDKQEAITKGDSLSFSIASAAIIAKVTRDNFMQDLSKKHPQFLWHKNKGYGTKEHRDAISKFGVCGKHRTSYCTGLSISS